MLHLTRTTRTRLTSAVVGLCLTAPATSIILGRRTRLSASALRRARCPARVLIFFFSLILAHFFTTRLLIFIFFFQILLFRNFIRLPFRIFQGLLVTLTTRNITRRRSLLWLFRLLVRPTFFWIHWRWTLFVNDKSTPFCCSTIWLGLSVVINHSSILNYFCARRILGRHNTGAYTDLTVSVHLIFTSAKLPQNLVTNQTDSFRTSLNNNLRQGIIWIDSANTNPHCRTRRHTLRLCLWEFNSDFWCKIRKNLNAVREKFVDYRSRSRTTLRLRTETEPICRMLRQCPVYCQSQLKNSCCNLWIRTIHNQTQVI